MHRIQAIDWTRGLVMILMALDHASLYWNHGRIQDEGLQSLYPTFTSTAQFLTRFITHPCAPAFIFITGMMMAITHSSTSVHSIKRGLLLVAADFLIINRMGLAFGVLACIGTSMILLSPAKFLPRHLVLSASILILILHPFIDFPKTDSYFLHILAEPTRKGLAPVLYPIIPWIGVMGLGFYFGGPFQKSIREGKPSRFGRQCLFLSLALMILFVTVRPLDNDHNSSLFWLMSKYPPSLSFLLWNLGLTFILLGGFLLWEAKSRKINALLRVLATYGRVPLFFYIVHRYLYGLIPNWTHTRGEYSLVLTYGVWLAGLVSLYFLCKVYGRQRLLFSMRPH